VVPMRGCPLGRVPVYGREGVGWQTVWGEQQARKTEGEGTESAEQLFPPSNQFMLSSIA
jgi:hypothetical protein